ARRGARCVSRRPLAPRLHGNPAQHDRPRLPRPSERIALRGQTHRRVPVELRPLQPHRAGGLPDVAHRRPPRPAETADPQSVRPIHDALHARQAPARTRDHGAAMNADEKYVIAQHLKTPIAIINEHGGVEWRNDAFEATFGTDAKEWLTQAARAVAGERGWLQGFFLDADAHRSLDVDIEGRTYRVDKIIEAD